MFIYFFLLILSLLTHYIPKAQKTTAELFIVLILGIFFCSGYMTGSDWRNYEICYEDATWNALFNPSRYLEPGYYFYMLLAKSIGLSFWPFFIITKFILYIINVRYIYKYTKEYFPLALSFFLFVFGLYLFIDNPMRNFIANTIYLYAFPLIFKRKFLSYCGLVLLATSFHYSSVILLVFYGMSHKISTKNIVFAYICVNVLFVFDASLFIDFLLKLGIFEQKLHFYFLMENEAGTGTTLSFRLIFFIIIFCFLIRYREYIEKRPYGVILFNGAILYLFIFRVALSFGILFRYGFFFALHFSIAVFMFLPVLKTQMRVMYKFAIFLLISYSTFSIINSNKVYIPYTNYFMYLFNEKMPSYRERDSYNYRSNIYL